MLDSRLFGRIQSKRYLPIQTTAVCGSNPRSKDGLRAIDCQLQGCALVCSA